MPASHHIIRNLCLDIAFDGSEQEAIAIQNRLISTYDHWLLPSLAKAMDRHHLDDAHYYLDLLEIDAGILNSDDLEEQLGGDVERAIEKSLLLKDLSSQGKGLLKPSAGFDKRTNPEYCFDALISFLDNGSLPWSFKPKQGETLEQVLLTAFREEISYAELTSFKLKLFKAIASHDALERLILQFSHEFHKSLISLFSLENTKIVTRVLEKLLKENHTYISATVEKKIWKTVFTEFASARLISESDLILRTFYEKPLSKEQRQVLEHIWPDLKNKAAAKRGKAKEDNKENSYPGKTKNKPLRSSDIQEVYYIDNAGIVILHPYFPQFFEDLDIVRENRLVLPGRALYLMQYLSAGNKSVQEYDLILPKILCNIQVSMPVDTNIKLSPKEIRKSSVLLDSVIKNWDALGDTGHEGLRFNFFNRPGKLSYFQDYWLLQVEPRSYDILLDKLPWSVSIVQLPWMNQMINVEWR